MHLLRSIYILCVCVGRLVKLLSEAEGPLRAVNESAAAAIRALPSTHSLEPKYARRGEVVARTVDLNSAAGYVLLLGDDDVVAADWERVRELQRHLYILG